MARDAVERERERKRVRDTEREKSQESQERTVNDFSVLFLPAQDAASARTA